ncbi:hypothetical protein Vadar_019204 [Vaccinium darrowii]|uniref:Uncharacterized protein n=1 Tax=Vaccinium darrowii TaxID=229202 RepID=A0ACB7ZEV9_9ERIC|nr:hypothetical protein Vadar_019204 [Vaccinium darrowii]
MSSINIEVKKEAAGPTNQQKEDVLKAISGLGVDQKEIMAKVIPVMIPTWGTWNDEMKKYFMKQLNCEYLRFSLIWVTVNQRAVELWTKLRWERDRDVKDAHLIKDALSPKLDESYKKVIEIACTRSWEEFSRVQTTYQSLFHHSIAEDIYPEATLQQIEKDPDYKARIFDRKLVFALVSNCRYGGPEVNEDTAKSEAETLRNCFRMSNPMEEEVVVRILSTRSKRHLELLFKHYKDNYLSGKSRKAIDEDFDGPASLKQAVQCLSAPYTYFVKVLDAAMKPNATEDAKDGLIWVIATRADDIGKIADEYQAEYLRSLEKDIDRIAKGNFKDFLLTLLREKK